VNKIEGSEGSMTRSEGVGMGCGGVGMGIFYGSKPLLPVFN
jgi:hypothetical protein